MKVIISSISSLIDSFTINFLLHLANDSSYKHCTSDCLLILSGSGFTCAKHDFKSCTNINNTNITFFFYIKLVCKKYLY